MDTRLQTTVSGVGVSRRSRQLREMEKTCQLQCFSTLNSNLACCYNDKDDQPGEAIKNKFAAGVRSFADGASNVSPDTRLHSGTQKWATFDDSFQTFGTFSVEVTSESECGCRQTG
jgi:hypothetical protein